MINKDTVLCISAAEHPSNIGTTLYNAAFHALRINYIYKAFAISDIAGVITGIRALGIRGCSVSMPFKEAVISSLDIVHSDALQVNAVNTIVNQDGVLTGFNTDITGAVAALRHMKVNTEERVLILGGGGVARAILFALHEIGFSSVLVACRNSLQFEKLRTPLHCKYVAWDQRNEEKPDILINATSIGMAPDPVQLPVEKKIIDQCRAVFDVVSNPMETELIKQTKAKGKVAIPGYIMSLHQMAAQFKLYTGIDAPMEILENTLKDLMAK